MEHTQRAATAAPATEPEHERLIRIIQNREGITPKAEREEALLTLIKKFQYLIKKIATEVWRAEIGENRADWEHDTLTTFLELVVTDYIPPRYGGATTFAPYIQSKLYWKTLYRAQKLTKERNRAFPADLTSDLSLSNNQNSSGARLSSGFYASKNIPFFKEVKEALLANTSNLEDGILAVMRDEDIQQQLMTLRAIAADPRILDERERFVWDAYFFSPMMVREIGTQLNPQIGTSRVNQLVQQVRQKVLAEFARRRIGMTLNS